LSSLFPLSAEDDLNVRTDDVDVSASGLCMSVVGTEVAAEVANKKKRNRRRPRANRKRIRNPAYWVRRKSKKHILYVTIPHTPKQREVEFARNAINPVRRLKRSTVIRDRNGDLAIMFLSRVMPSHLVNPLTSELEHYFDRRNGGPLPDYVPYTPSTSTSAVDALPAGTNQSESSSSNGRSTFIPPLQPPPLQPPPAPQQQWLPAVPAAPPARARAPRGQGRKRTPWECNQRQQVRVEHIGVHRTYTMEPEVMRSTASPLNQEFLRSEAFQNYNKELDVVVEGLMPMMRDFLVNYQPPVANITHIPFPEMKPWGALGLVEGITEKIHVDPKDARNALNGLAAFGKYKGGDVYFPDLNISVRLKPGDLLLFKTHLLRHKSTKLVCGRRFVTVFYASHNVYI